MKKHPLKIWRLSQNPPLSQRKLAKKAGCSDMTISRLEQWNMPTLDKMGRLFKITGLKPNDFYKPLAIPARGNRKE